MIPKTRVHCCAHRKNSSCMGGGGLLLTLSSRVNMVISAQKKRSSSRLDSRLESGGLEGISQSASFRSIFGPTTVSPRTHLRSASIFAESGGDPAGRLFDMIAYVDAISTFTLSTSRSELQGAFITPDKILNKDLR